jgi:glutathione S-transferase
MQVMIYLQLTRVDPSSSNPATTRAVDRLSQLLAFVDARLNQNEWLAGDEFTAADIMTVFSLTTMRTFCPIDLTPYKGILAYLERIVQREGYKKARAKADPQLELMIDGNPPKPFVQRLKEQGKM